MATVRYVLAVGIGLLAVNFTVGAVRDLLGVGLGWGLVGVGLAVLAWVLAWIVWP